MMQVCEMMPMRKMLVPEMGAGCMTGRDGSARRARGMCEVFSDDVAGTPRYARRGVGWRRAGSTRAMAGDVRA